MHTVIEYHVRLRETKYVFFYAPNRSQNQTMHTMAFQETVPIDAIKPEMPESMVSQVAQVEMPPNNDDIYQAQLQQEKAKKIASAQALVTKAQKDPKVIKTATKRTGRGKRAKGAAHVEGAGNGAGAAGEQEPKPNPSDESKVVTPETVQTTPQEPAPKGKAKYQRQQMSEEAVAALWKEKDTYLCNS